MDLFVQVCSRIWHFDIFSNALHFGNIGDMIALMGPSGAGKSTLLDVLAQKKNVGKIDGTFLLNGKNPNEFYSRFFGYVEQFDSHMQYFTVCVHLRWFVLFGNES